MAGEVDPLPDSSSAENETRHSLQYLLDRLQLHEGLFPEAEVLGYRKRIASISDRFAREEIATVPPLTDEERNYLRDCRAKLNRLVKASEAIFSLG